MPVHSRKTRKYGYGDETKPIIKPVTTAINIFVLCPKSMSLNFLYECTYIFHQIFFTKMGIAVY